MKYILVGNPNVGKTTFFNLLTDANNKITNFAGTTVDVVERKIKHSDALLVDLPGVRALSNSSEDEYITTAVVLAGAYDGIINIIDSNNIKRNLHLSLQLLESGKPLNFILNMRDELDKQQIVVDLDAFAKWYGPVQFISAKKEKNTDEIISHLQTIAPSNIQLDYGKDIESCITAITNILTAHKYQDEVDYRFVALQLLAKNAHIFATLPSTVATEIEQLRTQLETQIKATHQALSLNGLLFKVRRTYIEESLAEILIHTAPKQIQSSRLDKITMHKFWGVPIFFFVFYSVFYATFKIGDPVTGFLESSILVPLGEWFRALLTQLTLPNLLISLLIDGAYAGFSTIIMFFPQIILVFVFLALLEGSGYTSRAIILFDKLFSSIGLNGKAIAPLLIGMGCSVPAIMAARTISDKRERTITQLIIPFISCSARLEIYVFFIGLFFTKHQALILMGINILGFLVALASAKLFSLTLFKKQHAFFMVEIPPFRMVNWTYIYKMTRNKTQQFFAKAGKFIVIGSIAIWILLNFGITGVVTDINDSFFALIGHMFAWIFEPLGFGFWQATSSLITGFLAKELVVAQLGVLLSDYPTLAQGVHALFTIPTALSFMVFNLLYIPCLSTVATLKQELQSWKMVGFSIGYSFVAAYIVSFIVYQIALMILS